MSKFQIWNANLQLGYCKICEFMVYTFICAFGRIKFFWLLRPSKSSGAFKEDLLFGFLTFEYLWIKDIGSTFLKILSCNECTLMFLVTCNDYITKVGIFSYYSYRSTTLLGSQNPKKIWLVWQPLKTASTASKYSEQPWITSP